MTRDEHMQWAKARALEYLDRGDLPNAHALGGQLNAGSARELIEGAA